MENSNRYKFRAWNRKTKEWFTDELLIESTTGKVRDRYNQLYLDVVLMQYTGLKDKNGLQEVYEGDIIDEYGNIKGNIYEMDAGETDFIIQGFGDKNWGATYQNAVDRGCKDSE